MRQQRLPMPLSAALSTVFITGSALGKQTLAHPKQPDYTSLVPKFIFADTLEEQEAQLRTNPLMERFVRALIALPSDYDCWRPHGAQADKQALLQEIITNLQTATNNCLFGILMK